MSFSRAWQSSKSPSSARAWTLASDGVVIWRRCTSDTRPCGNRMKTSTLARPRNASIAADPVSPAGGADDGDPLARPGQRRLHHLADELHGEILEGQRRPVEQLQQEMVRASCTSGARAAWPKPA
jgi:hypothetical protein